MRLTYLIFIIGFATSYAFLPEKDLGEELQRLSKVWHDKCILITGTTEARIDTLKNGDFTDDGKIKSYVSCLWLLADVMNPDISVNTKLFKERFPKKLPAVNMEAYMKCLRQATESDVEEFHDRTWKLTKCAYEADPENFIMF